MSAIIAWLATVGDAMFCWHVVNLDGVVNKVGLAGGCSLRASGHPMEGIRLAEAVFFRPIIGGFGRSMVAKGFWQKIVFCFIAPGPGNPQS